MEEGWSSGEMEPRGKVLVVDDEPNVLAMLNDFLYYEGFAVETANNGLDALSCLHQEDEENHVDVVVTDVMMPRMDGLTLASRISREQPSLPIILLSAASDHARESPWPFLGKPFDLDDLLELIEDAIGDSDVPPGPMNIGGGRGQAAS